MTVKPRELGSLLRNCVEEPIANTSRATRAVAQKATYHCLLFSIAIPQFSFTSNIS
ncbi:MAG: hypothetical protein WBM37_14610 [Nitrososphaeraceae archaeon]